jgi:hypothetical protein
MARLLSRSPVLNIIVAKYLITYMKILMNDTHKKCVEWRNKGTSIIEYGIRRNIL